VREISCHERFRFELHLPRHARLVRASFKVENEPMTLLFSRRCNTLRLLSCFRKQAR
jgi:hypothetical protein